MGNIQIRQQSNPGRRTQIFNQRKSFDPLKISPRNSLSQRLSYNPTYSPIRYTKKSLIKYNQPLTERKVNTDRLDRYNVQQNNNELTLSPYNPDQQKLNKSNTLISKVSKFTKIKSLQTQNFPQQLQQPINSFNLTGKIVSNSKRVNQERKAVQYMNSTLKKQINTQRQNILQTPYDNREIIKKVRNFNDFLNEIKRKLKQDKQQNLLRNRYQTSTFDKIQIPYKNVQEKTQYKKPQINQPLQNYRQQQNFQKTKSTRKIEVALKLQNQKLELEKYRKLVERQLSKTHSIENISLCTKNSGQKILTIQYESILPYNILSIQNSKSSLKNETLQPSVIQKNNSIHSQFIEEGFIINEKIKANEKFQQKIKQRQMLQKLKNQYEKIKKNMLDLGKLIEVYEKGLEDDNLQQKSQQKILIRDESLIDNFSKLSSQKNSLNPLISLNQIKQNGLSKVQKQNTSVDMSSSKKIQKIDGLFSRLYSLQNEYQQTDRQIREAIQNSNSQSLLEESFRSKFSSFAPNEAKQIK